MAYQHAYGMSVGLQRAAAAKLSAVNKSQRVIAAAAKK
jgi:hypothetical protein